MALLKSLDTRMNDELKTHQHVSSSHPVTILSQLTHSQEQAKNVMSDLSKLSQSFVDSFQNIEGKVEELSDQLSDAENRHLIEKNEKIKLQSENNIISNRLNNLLDILPSGVVLLDNQGFVCDCNQVASDILGRPLLGEAWINVIERAFSPQADDGHQVSLKDGRKIHIETTSLSPEPGQMLVLTDLTKTRQLQDKLSQQNKLSSMGKMIASLAHQIRTPLSAAMIYGSHIGESNLEQNQVKKFSENLMERLKFMDRQIHDMLQFVRGERKQKQEINIGKLFDELKLNLNAHHRVKWNDSKTNKDNKLQTANEINLEAYSLLGSHDDLTGAISNLVENALSATNQEQNVTISYEIVKEKSNHSSNDRSLCIQISDQGVGMTKEQQEQIFEPFYTTKNNGNGLGLAIVRGVVIEHCGNISLKSKLGVGSIFTINLPIYKDSHIKYKSNESDDFISEVIVND